MDVWKLKNYLTSPWHCAWYLSTSYWVDGLCVGRYQVCLLKKNIAFPSFLAGHGICLKDIIGSICNLKASWELLRPFWHFLKRNPWGFPACCETDSLSHNSRASQFLRAVKFLSSIIDLWVGFGEHQVFHNYQSQFFRQQPEEEKTIEFCMAKPWL